MNFQRSSTPRAATPLSHVARVALIAAAAWAGAHTESAQAWPGGERVIRGNVSFQRDGNRTIIRASDGSIISYLNFNIGRGDIVRFIQPNEWARVLNRITGNTPTLIQGTLLANGQVYIVNPAGVTFGNGAVVDVSGLFAAAGNLSNAKFLMGVDKFSELSGSVVNHGRITGDNINLIGQSVLNTGAIKARDAGGMIVMAAGDQVYIKQQGGRITLVIDGTRLTDRGLPQSGSTTPDMTATPGVENTGRLVASRGAIALGAGDLYALAVRNSGRIAAAKGEITVAAVDGLVQNTATGIISADTLGGHAGSVTVQAPSVLNAGSISADSPQGSAGDVEVTSQDHTFLTNGSRVSAAGGAGVADGGDVLVHSYNGLTAVTSGAAIDVSGGDLGGDGGFAEVSGKLLTFNAVADLEAQPGSTPGRLLLDPFNLVVNATGGDEAYLNGNIITFDEPNTFTNVFIRASALEALVGAITLQATNDIAIFEPLTFVNGNDLSLQAYHDIFIRERISGLRNMEVLADFDHDGAGVAQFSAEIDIAGGLTVDGADTFLFNGPITARGGQDYLGPVNLCTDMVLNGDHVQFHDTLNAVEDAGQGLTVNITPPTGPFDHLAIFDGPVGGLRQLKSLRVNGPTEINGGQVQTRGFQKYYGPVTLGDDAALTSSNSGTILFDETLDGRFNLFAATAGSTIFNGNTGFDAKLESVVTDAPGNTKIAGDMRAGILDFNDPVILLDDVVLDGSDSVDFAQTVAGNQHDLIVNSPVTGFHGNATGLDLLRTNAAGLTTIGRIDSPESPAEPIHVSGNQLDFNDHVALISDAVLTGHDFVDFDRTVNGAFALTTNSDRLVRFGGDVGGDEALASLTTNVGPQDLIDQNLVIIDGNLIRASGDIRFNPGGRSSPAEVATIAARNFGGITIKSDGGDINIGPNEKMTSLGDLNFIAPHGTLTIGDLNAYGDVFVDADAVNIRRREPGRILTYSGDYVDDNGTTIVVFGGVSGSAGQVNLIGSGADPVFSSRVLDNLGGPAEAFLKHLFATLEQLNFTFEGTVLDLRPPPSGFELIDQTTGPARIKDKIVLDPIAILPMADQFALNTRPLDNPELSDAVTGRYVYNDMFSKPPTGPQDRTVVASRLRRDAVLGSINGYSAIYYRQETDPETGELKPPVDQTAAVKAALGGAWKAYQASDAGSAGADPVAFHDFLASDEQYQPALAYFDGLRKMVRDLKVMGLTGLEYRMAIDKALPQVRPDGLDKARFEQLLGV